MQVRNVLSKPLFVLALLLAAITTMGATGDGRWLVPVIQNAYAGEVVQDPVSKTEMDCLIIAGWVEARGRPKREVEAVMHTIRNRAESGRFPETVCGVLLQPGQFSLTPKWRERLRQASRGKPGTIPMPKAPGDQASLMIIIATASDVLHGRSRDITRGATHFYTPSLRRKLGLSSRPDWAIKLARTVSIGEFVFHRS